MNVKMVFEQGDAVLIAVFLTLVLMSVLTWTVIIVRSLSLYGAKRANKKVSTLIWVAQDFRDLTGQVKQIRSPISELTLSALAAQQQYRQQPGQQLTAALPFNEYLLRQMRHSIMQILHRFDGGLTTLASIGATAPFIGLFGTVWGIYHALINIAQSGHMSIAAVAGPIGEALVATAAGLFVAIPAVLAYNTLVRGNKILARDLDGFAHDLHVQLVNQKD